MVIFPGMVRSATPQFAGLKTIKLCGRDRNEKELIISCSRTAYRAVISIFRLVVEHVEPGVLVQARVVVRRLYGWGDVEAVGESLQGGVPVSRVMTPAYY